MPAKSGTPLRPFGPSNLLPSHLSPLCRGKQFGASQTHPGQTKAQPRSQTPKAIADAPPQVDGRRLREILRRAAYLGNAEAMPEDLRQHLVIEHEVIRVPLQAQPLEDCPRERAVAGVVL